MNKISLLIAGIVCSSALLSTEATMSLDALSARSIAHYTRVLKNPTGYDHNYYALAQNTLLAVAEITPADSVTRQDKSKLIEDNKTALRDAYKKRITTKECILRAPSKIAFVGFAASSTALAFAILYLIHMNRVSSLSHRMIAQLKKEIRMLGFSPDVDKLVRLLADAGASLPLSKRTKIADHLEVLRQDTGLNKHLTAAKATIAAASVGLLLSAAWHCSSKRVPF